MVIHNHLEVYLSSQSIFVQQVELMSQALPEQIIPNS